jgi:polysaccharide export outer membrane protein
MSVRRARIPWSMLTACVACLLPVAHVFAQSSGGSLADLEQQVLQGLSPEQRDSIMNQLGVGNGTGASSGGLGGSRQNDERQQQNDVGQQGLQRRLTPEQQEEMERLSPYLAPQDWIVIGVDSDPLPALATGPSPQPLGAAGAFGVPSSVLANLQQNPALSGATAGAPPNATGSAPPTGATGATTATAGGYASAVPNTPGPPGSDAASQNRPDLSDEEAKQRQRLIDLIRSKNPYQLSREGVLSLPGFAPIPLAGLTEQLATLRLGVEPALRQLFVRVTKLPLRKLGPTSLKPFGYDLFDRPISTFAPVTNVPVPANYVVGPGDQLEVQLYGNKNFMLHLVVGRDGRVQFPDLGPISVAGQTFDSAKATLEARVARQMIGVRASVTMGDTRSIRVFVLGAAKQAGSYTISGLGTITSALFAAGGVLPVGSLRNIQLKRQGALVRQLDLYDMLIRGDTTDDAKLLPGDVIFVPPVGATVTVDGEVRRPAIYETKGETAIGDVVQLAGGLTPEADRQKAALTRIDVDQRRVVLQVDLTGLAIKGQPVRDGDSLRVPRLRPTLDAGVLVEGYVYSTGAFAYHDGLRISDVIHSADELRPNADQHYLLIRRELPPDRRIVVLSADLDAALKAPGSAADVLLRPRDHVMVFDLQSSRDRVIQPLLDDLKLQSTSDRPPGVVRVEGRVNVPGEYPLEEGMTVRDLVRAGGSLGDAAYGGKAELTRYRVINGESRRSELVQIDLAAALRGDPDANIRLEPFDSLSVKEVQAWNEQEEVTLLGEVRFPGKYSLKRGETLKSVLMRAGGLTDLAFEEGAVFTRRELREREQKQLDLFAKRMQSDIAFIALQGVNSNQSQAATALSVGQSLLEQLRSTKAVGRLVINLKATLGAPVGSSNDVMLRGGDRLLIPKYQQEVTVIGEVQNTTSHLYRPGLKRADYIALSGGETRRADGGRTYVVRADGNVVASSGRWFRHDAGAMKPGDTVVVPLNAEHMPPLPLWQAVTQIIYNVAIAAAAVHSLR